MNVTSAIDFLSDYLLLFKNEVVRSWVWESEDSDFGKCVSWPVMDGSGMECVATVDTVVVFDALISFEDRTVTLNGEPLGYTEDAIREVINQFNQRV
jgi:hypothetical protein